MIGQHYKKSNFPQSFIMSKYTEKIALLDYQVKNLKETIVDKGDMYINSEGRLYFQDILKIPLGMNSNKVSMILTIMVNRSKELDNFRLFNLYIKQYKDPYYAIKNFTRSLGIAGFFNNDLTHKELLCLLNMQISQAYKTVAKELNISVKTVEIHISHIISKLKNPYFQLSNVLSHMRRN